MSRTPLSLPLALESRVLPSSVVAVREATGLDPQSLSGTIEQFRTDLGNFSSTLDWEQVASNIVGSQPLPGEYFQTIDPKGVRLRTTGSEFRLETGFPTFTGTRTLAPLGSTQTVVDFFLPDGTTPANVNGFGAVFSDVDGVGPTRLSFIANDGAVLHEQVVPASPDGLSFVGVTFATSAVARVRITNGTISTPTTAADNADADAVRVDDFVYGRPTTLLFQIPDPQRVSTGDRLTFSAANRNALAVRRGDDSIDVTVRVHRGTFRVANLDGITLLTGDGIDESAVTMRGSISAINAALDGLRYTPMRGFVGNEQLVLSGEDGAVQSRVTIRVEGSRIDQNQTFWFATTDGTSITLHNADGSKRLEFPVPESERIGGVRVAVAEMTGDGRPDVVTSAGPGSAPMVRIFDGASGKELQSFLAYEEAFQGGVFVSLADLSGDGIADIIMTPDEGGGPRVRIVDGRDFSVIADFLGIDDPNFRGGARAASGDLNRDGIADLLIGAGFGGGPRLAVYSGRSLAPGFLPEKLFPDFFVFEDSLRNGVFLSAGDLNADGHADVIVGGGPGGGPRIMALDAQALVNSRGADRTTLANYFAGDLENRGGVRLAVKDLDGDDRADVLVASGDNATPEVLGFYGNTLTPDGSPTPAFRLNTFPDATERGIYVG